MNYEILFRHLPVAVAVVDSRLLIRDVSQGFAKLVGIEDMDAARGTSLFGTPGIEMPRSDLVTKIRSAVETGESISCSLDANPSSDPPSQTRVWVEILPVEPSAADERLAIVVVATTTNATPVNELASLQTGIRAIKHEINNPLTGALGNINLLLRRSDLDEKTRKRLTTAEQEIKKVSQLVLRLAELLPSQRVQTHAPSSPDASGSEKPV